MDIYCFGIFSAFGPCMGLRLPYPIIRKIFVIIY